MYDNPALSLSILLHSLSCMWKCDYIIRHGTYSYKYLLLSTQDTLYTHEPLIKCSHLYIRNKWVADDISTRK